MTHLEATSVLDRPPQPERLEVGDPGRRSHQDSGADHVGPPRQVEVLAEELDARVEAAERGEQVGAHQGGGAGDVEDVADSVVLLLVELAALDVRGRGTGLVRPHPHLQQPLGVVPLDQLGAHDAGVGTEGLLDHDLHDVGLETHVVVAEQVEGRALDGFEHLVGRGAEADVGVESAHVGVGRDRRDPGRQVLGAGAVDDEEGRVAVGLRRHAAQGVLEPVPRIVGHDHHHDCGCHRLDLHRWRPEGLVGPVGLGRPGGWPRGRLGLVRHIHDRGRVVALPQGSGPPLVGGALLPALSRSGTL